MIILFWISSIKICGNLFLSCYMCTYVISFTLPLGLWNLKCLLTGPLQKKFSNLCCSRFSIGIIPYTAVWRIRELKVHKRSCVIRQEIVKLRNQSYSDDEIILQREGKVREEEGMVLLCRIFLCSPTPSICGISVPLFVRSISSWKGELDMGWKRAKMI